MISKYSLDEKLKERENAIVLNKIEDARRFVRYFVNLIEDILNYNYSEFSSYFEEKETKIEIRLVEKDYELLYGYQIVGYQYVLSYVKKTSDVLV